MNAEREPEHKVRPLPIVRAVYQLTWVQGPRRRWYRRIANPFRSVFAQVRAWSANALLRAGGCADAVLRRSQPDAFSYVAGVLVGAACALLWVWLVFGS